MKAPLILNFEPVNEAYDLEKTKEIKSSIKKHGWVGCPILTYGNVLITGSHRQAALRELDAEDEDIYFDCAVDVTDIIDQRREEGIDVFENLDTLKNIFEGTWVEEYKSQIKEW